MQETRTVLVLGAHSREGIEWLRRSLPTEGAGPAWVVQRPGAELDAVLFAEDLRARAQRDGVRLSIGVAETLPGMSIETAAHLAALAYRRAFALGGDITLAHSNLLRAA
ncbi:MAG: hypothetical protein AB7S26_37720 [Sandaracinaceae bacterium]